MVTMTQKQKTQLLKNKLKREKQLFLPQYSISHVRISRLSCFSFIYILLLSPVFLYTLFTPVLFFRWRGSFPVSSSLLIWTI